MTFRNDFSVSDDFIYLNSGSMALSPKMVIAANQTAKQEFEENPAHGLFSAWPKMWQVQTQLAQFLNARPQDLYLRSNVTYAMNDFLMALRLPKDSEIILTDVEYGAIVNICRYKAQLEGHTIKTISGDQNILSHLEQAITSKTKLVMISHVTTGAGLVFPIEKIAQLCRAHSIFLAVDGAHGAGSVPLDFANTQVDFYGSNLHKWMMGPKGTGFGWVAPSVREHLVPQFAGWTTLDIQAHFKAFGGGDDWTTRWMICSTVNFSDFYAISAMLTYWQKKSPAAIMEEQRRLRNLTAEIVGQKTRWPCLSNFSDPAFVGPMVAFLPPERISQRGFEVIFHLREKMNLQISMTSLDNNWCVRLAPHIYNSEAEIERCGRILASL